MIQPATAAAAAPAEPLCVVTAANEAYSRCLWQFLRGLERVGWDATVLVYDLGLGERRAGLERRFPRAVFRTFDFARHPPHVARIGNYAWKPILIAEVVGERTGDVLWLDSATLLRESPGAIHRRLRRRPIFTLSGQSTLAQHCAPQVLAALAVPAPARDRREQVSGVVGVCGDSPLARELIAEWCALALRPELIDPAPAFPDHKFDQALLSIVLHPRVLAGELALSGEDIDLSCPDPARWFSSRNKVNPAVPGWADPLVRTGYWLGKTFDQALWRVKRFKATRVNGLHRWPKEKFQVFVQRAEENPVALPAPRWSYYADPFLAERDSRRVVFVEEFQYLEHRGRLVAVPLDAGLRAGTPQPLELRGGPPGHLSYPFVFPHAGALYLLPESSANRAVDLFVCEEFPLRWRWVRRLLENIDAVDSNLLHHDGRWWLFTFARPAAADARALLIFHTDELEHGRWEPHPVNRERRHAAAPFGSGRGAGAFLPLPDGTWLRPIQASTRYYGEGVRFMRIDTLTPDLFSESEFTGTHPAADLARKFPLHHLAAHGDVTAYDARLRVSYGQHVPWPRRWATVPDARIAQLPAPPR